MDQGTGSDERSQHSRGSQGVEGGKARTRGEALSGSLFAKEQADLLGLTQAPERLTAKCGGKATFLGLQELYLLP